MNDNDLAATINPNSANVVLGWAVQPRAASYCLLDYTGSPEAPTIARWGYVPLESKMTSKIHRIADLIHKSSWMFDTPDAIVLEWHDASHAKPQYAGIEMLNAGLVNAIHASMATVALMKNEQLPPIVIVKQATKLFLTGSFMKPVDTTEMLLAQWNQPDSLENFRNVESNQAMACALTNVAAWKSRRVYNPQQK